MKKKSFKTPEKTILSVQKTKLHASSKKKSFNLGKILEFWFVVPQ